MDKVKNYNMIFKIEKGIPIVPKKVTQKQILIDAIKSTVNKLELNDSFLVPFEKKLIPVDRNKLSLFHNNQRNKVSQALRECRNENGKLVCRIVETGVRVWLVDKNYEIHPFRSKR